MSGLRGWKVRKNGQSNQPEKPRAPRAAEESSGKGRAIPHNTTPSLCIVAEEGKEKQLLVVGKHDFSLFCMRESS
jgi:hypothetical protein